MKSLKIAIVTPYGAEPRFDNYAEFILAQYLIKSHHAVRLYTYTKKDPWYIDTVYKTVPVTRCRQRFGFSPRLFFKLMVFKPDVVLFFHPRSFLNFTAYCAGRFVGAKIIAEIVGILHDPFVVSDRDDPIGNLHQPVVLYTRWRDVVRVPFSARPFWNWKNFIFHMPTAKADVIIAINRDEQQYVKKLYHRDSTVLYWCIRKDLDQTAVKPSEEKYGVLPKSYLFFIGQLKRRKGWDTALETVATLAQRGIHKDLIFVSANKDISEAEEYADRLKIRDHVHFLTNVTNEEKNWLYAHSEYVLVPSRYEGFGLPVFEAFKAGKPLLATDTPVFLEFLQHEQNAMISPMGDGKAMALNVERLDNDEDLRRRLVANGFQTAERFSEDVMLDGYRELIERVVSH